ncbi:MAG: hypothetical protein JWM74_4622 [Myxococcaceae bacterium]|nr:hypothetical protein [Myxococcaceae bacterium]
MEVVCAFLAREVRRKAGCRWLQGRWQPPLAMTSTTAANEAVRLIAEHRLRGVPRQVAVGLVAAAHGDRPLDVLDRVPSAREVLALQARGRRCVSLLDDASSCAPHADPLAFALHDLCHLEKMVDPAHYTEQVGFFRAVLAATEDARWNEFDERFDDAWRRDFEHVTSDMNGSVIFLFAALQMKLKMAVRRRHAKAIGAPEPTGGPLTMAEADAFAAAQSDLLDLLALHGDVRSAALLVTTRRDTPSAAYALAAHYSSWMERSG